MFIKSTITCPICQGQNGPSEDACSRSFPSPALLLRDRALVGILPLLRAFLRGRMVNMPAIGPHGASIDTFLTKFPPHISTSPEHPISVRSPHSIIWQGVLRWVMN